MKITCLQDKLKTFSPPTPLKENVECNTKFLNNLCFVRLQTFKVIYYHTRYFFTTHGFDTLLNTNIPSITCMA